MIVIENLKRISKEYFTVKSLIESRDKIGFRCLANNYVRVFIADKISRNFRVFLSTFYVVFN